MKKIYLVLVAFALLFVGCNDDEGGSVIQPVEHTVQVNYDDNYDSLAGENVTVVFTNNETNQKEEVVTDAQGMANAALLPGTYAVNASITMTPAQYEQKFGQSTDGDVSFNAVLEAVTISSSSPTTTPLILKTGRIGSLVISQVYNAGSDVRRGAVFRDQFFQIHNNSNETLYLDGLCFAQLFGTSSTPRTLRDYHTPDGQYDWSKSVGNTKGNRSLTDYVYADEILRIPGTGQQYPIESGKSVIIAASALNHKAPLTVTGSNGQPRTYEVEDPSLTVDLSQAPFEANFRQFLIDNGREPYNIDVDNPNSVNLDVVFRYGARGAKDMILDPFGRDAYIIFYASQDDINNWTTLALPSIATPSATSLKYKQIPIADVIDGVHLQRIDPSRVIPRRMPSTIDAGMMPGIRGKFSSEALIRKIKGQNGDKIFYQDTNNSINDFEVIDRPKVS